MSSANQLLLEAKNVTKYFGTITALENVNLKIHANNNYSYFYMQFFEIGFNDLKII